MSRELHDFSAQIDEQFDLADVKNNSFWYLLIAVLVGFFYHAGK